MNISIVSKTLLSAMIMALSGSVGASGQFLPGNKPLSPEIGRLNPGGAAVSGYVKGQPKGPIYYIGENNPLTPPFTETFDNLREGMEHDDFARYFQVIDQNNDGRKWGLYNYSEAKPYGRCAYMLFPMEQDADDWLITRAIKLERGKYYCISMDAALYMDDEGGTPQVFEVKVGTYNDADGLNTTVIEPVKVSSKTFKHVSGWFKPDFTATYYVGVHGISPYYSGYYNYLFVDNITVDAPKEGTVPSTVTDLSWENDPDGTPAVTISFNAPAVSLNGNPLPDVVSVLVLRDDKVAHTFENVQPGERCTFVDRPDEDGAYTYQFIPLDETDTGATYSEIHTCGVEAPVAPVITSFSEVEAGKVHMEWKAPTKDVNGNELNPDLMTYNLYDAVESNSFLIDAGIEGSEYTYTLPLEEGEQKATLGLLTAVFNDKESERTATPYITVGTPYPLPHHNSFTLDDYDKYVMINDIVEGVTWRMLDDYSEPHAQDGDNGYVCMVGSQPGQSCELQFGKIDLTGAKAPVLSFFTYVYSEDENDIEVSVIDVATGERTQLPVVNLIKYTRVGWNRVVLSLGDWAGKVVRIGINGVIHTHGYIPIDNLLVQDTPEVDLTIDEVEYQRQAEVGELFVVKASIFNMGSDAATDYSVALVTEDGREAFRTKAQAIPHLGSVIVNLFDEFNIASPATTRYKVVVDIDGDANPENNESNLFDITFIAPNFPVATSLTANEEGNNVQLAWTAPDLSSAAPESATEGFESYEPFAETFDGWVTKTLDSGYVAGFNNITMPVDGDQMGFWVMSDEGDYEFLTTHSGHRMAVAMYGLNATHTSGVASDDWLISPELYGGAQTINFWASSLTDDYGLEQFEVLYSTKTNSTDDFRVVTYTTEAPVDWTQFYVALPEGTKYFAIRYVSDNRYMFLVDDITYIPAGDPRELNLLGYNVYKNGECITAQPVSATTFSTPKDDDNDVYFVTAVYAEGESVASNQVSLGLGGIDGVDADGVQQGEVEIFDLRGIKLSPANLTPGVYIMRQGNKVSKVVVK